MGNYVDARVPSVGQSAAKVAAGRLGHGNRPAYCLRPPGIATLRRMEKIHHPTPRRARTLALEQRRVLDRRKTTWRTFIYGMVYHRRREQRRAGDTGVYVDWYEPALLASCVTIAMLCVMDAFLTLQLLQHGASEINPIMDVLIKIDPVLFVQVKLALTFTGLLSLVLHKNFRLFGAIPVVWIVHGFMLGYATLFSYQIYLIGLVH